LLEPASWALRAGGTAQARRWLSAMSHAALHYFCKSVAALTVQKPIAAPIPRRSRLNSA